MTFIFYTDEISFSGKRYMKSGSAMGQGFELFIIAFGRFRTRIQKDQSSYPKSVRILKPDLHNEISGLN